MDSVLIRTVAGAEGRQRLMLNVTVLLAFATLSALILEPLFRSMAALAFLLFGGLLVVTRPTLAVGAVLRHWYLFALPAFCVVSVLWSEVPSATLRYSLQLTLTFLIAIVIANRISAAAFLRCLFGIYGIGVVGSLLFGRVRDDIGAWLGIFGSKNAFAAVVSGFALTSIAVLFDRNAPLPMRALALASLALAPVLLLKAQSAGAMVFLSAGIAVSLGFVLSRRLNRAQKFLMMTAGAVVALLGSFAAIVYQDYIFNTFLDFSGKDVTLTGRTDLWDVAQRYIGERPLLGVGYQAFWVQGNGPAEVLWAMFGVQARAGFHFHNFYLSNAVEIGLIGLSMQVAILFGAAWRAFGWALRSPSAESTFIASFLTVIISSSVIEVPVFFQFSVTTIIVLCCFVYATAAARESVRARQRRRPARPLPETLIGLADPPAPARPAATG